MPGPIGSFLAGDHQRLADLLQRAGSRPGEIDAREYAAFRAGLLKHIAVEEKDLLPFAQERRGGKPLPMAAKLRIDHSALAGLLVPMPTPAILKTMKRILDGHNVLEEGAEGLYDICDRLAVDKAEEIVSRLRGAREVRTAPHVDGPHVMEAAKRAVERAGYELEP